MNLLGLFLSLSFAMQGDVVAIKSVDSDRQSYEAWLNVQRNLTPYSTFVEKGSVDITKVEKKINDTFYLAKSQALKGHSAEAKELFLLITEGALAENWKTPQQEIIFHSFMYLSEISDSPNEKKLWIKKAILFLPWYLPDFTSYSLATQNLFKKMLQEMKSRQYIWRPFERFSKFDFILVNGSRFDISPETEITLGPDQYRLSFVSSDLTNHTRLVPSDSVDSIVIPDKALVSGSCATPKANLPVLLNSYYVVFFDKKCIKTFDGKNWGDYQQNNLISPVPSYNLNSGPFNSMDFKHEENRRKKHWKWVGITALAAVIGYAIYDHNRPTDTRQVILEPED